MFNSQWLSFQIHGGGGHGSGAADSIANFLSMIDQLFMMSPEQIFQFFMPGLASMANIHPLIVHFPIVFLLSFFVLDVTGAIFKKQTWRESASILLYTGTLAAAVTVLAGFQAANTVAHNDVVHLVLEQHKHYGLMVTALASLLSVWRIWVHSHLQGFTSIIHILLSAVVCVIMLLGADLGGYMVYKHGVGVAAVVQVESGGHDHGSHSHTH